MKNINPHYLALPIAHSVQTGLPLLFSEVFFMEEIEIWKPIKGFETFYQVSNFGNVKSLNYRGFGYAKNMKLCLAGNGYYTVKLSDRVKRKTYSVHLLVITAFLENTENKKTVNHKDGNRLNNLLSNLEWSTYKENNQHAYDELNKQSAWLGRFGKNHCRSKPIYQYDIDGTFLREWESQKQVQRELKIQQTGISCACNGKQDTSGGFIWKLTKT